MRLWLPLCKEVKSIKDILIRQKLNENVIVKGWIRSVQDFRSHFFCRIADGLGPEELQVVVDKKIVGSVVVGSAVVAEGDLVVSRGKQQSVEMKCRSIQTIGTMESSDFPLNLRQTEEPSVLRQQLHLRPKTSPFGSFLRVRNQLTLAIHDFFRANEFVSIHTPVITTNDCEGAGEAFKLTLDKEAPTLIGESADFFGQSVYLTVSGQLHLEAAASSIKNVYTFGPTFRAEKSLTRHHLAEFYMVEAEMAFVHSMDQLTQLLEDLVHSCIEQISLNSNEDLQRCYRYFNDGKTDEDLKVYLRNYQSGRKFIRISYDDAIDVLRGSGEKFQFEPKRGKDLQKAHEHFLLKHFGNLPLFVTHFPSGIKPFYMKRSDKGDRVLNFDLLAPFSGEICGGSLREDHYDLLEARLKELQLAERLNWYLELRKFGHPSLGGFGLGVERFLQSLMQIPNIKDAIPFPRWYKHCAL